MKGSARRRKTISIIRAQLKTTKLDQGVINQRHGKLD